MTDHRDHASTRGSSCAGTDAPETIIGFVGEMFTAKELEQILKISIKTVYRYVQQGLIPYVRIQSNVRFPKRQILEWIERQSYHPWPPKGNATRKH